MSGGVILLLVLLGLATLLMLLRVIGERAARRAEANAPRRGALTPVEGGAIHWTSVGDGPPIVCIHGLSGNHLNFYALTPFLSDRFRVISIDRPGSGYSRRRGLKDADLASQARMVAEFLAHEGIDRPVLVGHSLGGALSLQIALDYPDQVGALALLAPVTRPISPTPAVFKMIDIPSAWIRGVVAATVAGVLGPLQARGLMTQVFAPEPVPETFRAQGGVDLSLRPSGFLSASEDLAAQPPALKAFAERAAALRTPGAILFGDADEVLDAQANGADFAARAASLAYDEIEAAGHMIPVTHAEVCAALAARLADDLEADRKLLGAEAQG